MKKLTLLFLSAALGASVFAATFKVGDEVKLGGKVLVVVSLDDNGDPLFKTKADLKPEKKEPSFLATLGAWAFSSGPERHDTDNPADDIAEDFLASLRATLKRQGKEPCGHCYSMMEPGDPRIPKDHFNYRSPEEKCTSLLGCK